MGSSSILQLALFGLSIGIVVTYIQPAFIEVDKLQDTLFEYKENVARVEDTNTKLAQKIAIENSFAAEDLAALEVFLPSTVDDMTVMSDVYTIAQSAGVELTALASGAAADAGSTNRARTSAATAVTDASGRQAVDYTITVESSYEDFKNFLSLLEVNKYQFDVSSLTFGDAAEDNNAAAVASTDGSYTMTVRTYKFNYQDTLDTLSEEGEFNDAI